VVKVLYKPHSFRRHSLERLAVIEPILAEYARQRLTLTIRQLHYQLVARGLQANTPQLYGTLSDLMTNARNAGLADWDMIEDRGRNLVDWAKWSTPEAFLAEQQGCYWADLWAGQPTRIEVWTEKTALSGILRPVCDRHQVPFFSASGINSTSEMRAAGERFIEHYEAGQDVVVLFITDHDPTGIWMEADARERLALYAWREVDVRRIGLTLDQVRSLAAPPNFGKETDPRMPDYVARFGFTDTWELDAIEPRVLAQMVEDAILEIRDGDLWAEALERQDDERQEIDDGLQTAIDGSARGDARARQRQRRRRG
jgi:hypothetical protein